MSPFCYQVAFVALLGEDAVSGDYWRLQRMSIILKNINANASRKGRKSKHLNRRLWPNIKHNVYDMNRIMGMKKATRVLI